MKKQLTVNDLTTQFTQPAFIETCRKYRVKFASEADAAAAMQKGLDLLKGAPAEKVFDTEAIAAMA